MNEKRTTDYTSHEMSHTLLRIRKQPSGLPELKL